MLGPLCVVGLISFKGANDRAFFSFGAQPCVKQPNISFGSWLRHGDDKILRATNVVAYEQNIEVRAIADIASAKFTQSDNGQSVASKELAHKKQAGFGQIGKLSKDRLRFGQAERVAQNNAQQLSLPVRAYGIQIARIRAYR